MTLLFTSVFLCLNINGEIFPSKHQDVKFKLFSLFSPPLLGSGRPPLKAFYLDWHWAVVTSAVTEKSNRAAAAAALRVLKSTYGAGGEDGAIFWSRFTHWFGGGPPLHVGVVEQPVRLLPRSCQIPERLMDHWLLQVVSAGEEIKKEERKKLVFSVHDQALRMFTSVSCFCVEPFWACKHHILITSWFQKPGHASILVLLPGELWKLSRFLRAACHCAKQTQWRQTVHTCGVTNKWSVVFQ